jgi:hypothetical protein
MILHAPLVWIFVLSALIGLPYAFWIATIAYIVLEFGNPVKT